jgi:CRISPR-associated exonuclease Cas4
MIINATLINLYHVCKREMWLHANGIRMEHTSETVAEGKLIGETTYPQRSEKYTEVELSSPLGGGREGTGKIDFYDAKNKVVHEIKKSSSMEAAHEWQVKYYIWLLEQNGIEGIKGILEYPKLRETKEILLTEEDKVYLQAVVQQIEIMIAGEQCPPRINSKICKKCSYYDFCYIEET